MDLSAFEPHTSTAAVRHERTKLIGFTALMVLCAAAFGTVAGPPRLASALPRVQDVLTMLSGSSLPLADLVWMLVDAVWLLWAWIAISLCLQLLLVAADMVTHGGRWLVRLHRVADRMSVPLVRRAVAAAFAVQILSRGVPLAAAQTIPPTETSLVATIVATHDYIVGDAAPDDAATVATYQVRPGDTLWSIAERAYGSGAEYRRVLEANIGRRMPDGQVFTARGVIQPGWQLVLPGADPPVEVADDGERWYTVRAGDTLTAIAASALGDRTRWAELFETNLGASTPDGAHTLTRADLIWPGLRLRLPAAPSAGNETIDTATPASAEPDPADLAVASAPPITDAGPASDPTMADTPPLLRTPHALEPVVLEPADVVESPPEPAAAAAPPADADVSVPNGTWYSQLPAAPIALGGVGLAVVAGLAVGARRMRRLRPLPQEPESEVVVQGGFAEALLSHDLTRGLHGIGVDPVEALAWQLERFLLEYNLLDIGLLAVRHGRSSTTISLRCGLAEQAILVDLAPVFAERLDAEAEGSVSADQDVLLRLTRLRRTRLLPTADALHSIPFLVQLGVLYDRQVYSAAWDSLGHVLVVSLPGHGADTILTSLVATLTARRSPEKMQIWMLASTRSLPAPLFELPHLVRSVDPADDSELARAVDDLRAELDRRAANPSKTDLVVVSAELAALGAHAAELALLASHAAELGVRFVVASNSPQEAVASPLAAQFDTRMVLRMESEESSVALLGVTDAAFLGGGGRLLLRMDGRQPVELYGYQIAAEHLERLVNVMRSSYLTSPTEPTPPSEPTDSGQVQDPPATHPSEREAPQPEPEAEPVRLQLEPSATAQTSPSTPIQVFCFGGPRVLCAGQQVWPHLAGGDAKPWELLLYLASQPPEGVARDQAVEALWPEGEEPEDAPHRFRQLRYRLRRMLLAVQGAPANDGICLERGALRLDPGIVYSDAQEFLSLVRGLRVERDDDLLLRLERARAVYMDDLLDGPDARRYAWVHERDASGVTLREHFRRLFQQAMLRLAELYAQNDALEASAQLYQELTEMDPGDERIWLALFRVHAMRGSRLALVREEQRFRQMLHDLSEDMDVSGRARIDEPSREITQEIERLLASLHEPDREAATA